MVSGGEIFQVKRGRPRKLACGGCNLNNPGALLSRNSDYNSCEKNQIAPHHENLSQGVKSIISALLKHACIPNHIKTLPLVYIFEESAKRMMINELELAAISLIIDTMDWDSKSHSAEDRILYCFYLGKKQLESSNLVLDSIEESLKMHFKDISQSHPLLLKEVSIDIKKLSSRYRLLKRNASKININYNYYVDDILRISPPYKVTGKKQKIEMNSFPDINNELKETSVKDVDDMKNLESIITFDRLEALYDYENFYQNLSCDALDLICSSPNNEEYENDNESNNSIINENSLYFE